MKQFFINLTRGIRSIAYYLVLGIVTVPYGIFCLFCRPLSHHARYEIIRFWLKFIVASLRIICGIKYEVKGIENIPKQNGVILANHQSAYETFLLPLIFHQPTIILKKELLRIPFFGWGLALLEPIAVDRHKPTSSMNQILKIGQEKLDEGRFVLIFPESRRVKPGQKAKYSVGGALLAQRGKVPVIPVSHNAGACWPGKSFLKIPGTIKVIISPAIDTTNCTAEKILAKAKIRIEKNLDIINLETKT